MLFWLNLIGWITDTISPRVRQIVNVHLNTSKDYSEAVITLLLVHKLQDGLTTWHNHADPQGKPCVSTPSPDIKSGEPPKHRRGKRVVNQAETDPIKSSNRCEDSPVSASLSDRGFGRIWKSCHLINIQNACRSDAAHFMAVTMVL